MFDDLVGGLDNSVKLWDVIKVLQEVDTDADTSIPSSVHVLVVLFWVHSNNKNRKCVSHAVYSRDGICFILDMKYQYLVI